MGRSTLFFLTLGFFAACGGESVYTEGGVGGDGATGGSKGGKGGKGGSDGATGGTGGATGGTGGATGGTGGATGGTGGVTGGTGGATGGTGGRTGGTGGATGGVGGATGGVGGGPLGGRAGTGGGPAGAGGVGIVCPPGYANCAGSCVDLSSDLRACGACNNPCAAGELCEDGECVRWCPPGFSECFGLCVDTDNHRQFCGSCDRACGAGEICESGECIVSCQPGLVNCGGTCTSLEFDPRNCGACGNTCVAPPNMSATCDFGGCTAVCQEPFANCNGLLADGCEADLLNDEDNCGFCGNGCSNQLGCIDGSCPSGSYQWRLVTTNACNAWCSKAPVPFDTCAGPWACGPGTVGGLIWIYANGPSPPPNPASSATLGYGWVHWYCDRNGCAGPGEPSGSCDTAFDNSIYECVFE